MFAFAVVLVVLAAVVHVLGELWMSTGSWAIVFGLSPETAQGQYQGTYFAGRQIGDTVAPPLITACVLGLHMAGWFVLSALFVLGAVLYRPIINLVRPQPAASIDTNV